MNGAVIGNDSQINRVEAVPSWVVGLDEEEGTTRVCIQKH